MPDPAPLIIEELAHAYAGTPVLAPLSLTLEPGELLAVLGPSGCGKTTLLRAVAGLIDPTRGRITIGGELVNDDGRTLVPAEQRRVGLVFQDYALFGHMSVRANVAFGLPRARHHEVDAMLDLVGLRDLAERRPGQLSGGQQQRVAVARALAPQPRLMLFDEPFANLDPSLRDDLGVQVRALLHARGTAGLLVTHDRHDALGLGDRALLLLPGKNGATVGQLGTPTELYQRPVSGAVARLTGPVAVVPGHGDASTASSVIGTFPLREERRGALELLARPHELRFIADESGPLHVAGVRFLGAIRRLRLRGPVDEFDVDAPAGDAPPAEGSRGRVQALQPLWAVPMTDD